MVGLAADDNDADNDNGNADDLGMDNEDFEANVGGIRVANILSTRPKSIRLLGTNRHTCDPLKLTSTVEY